MTTMVTLAPHSRPPIVSAIAACLALSTGCSADGEIGANAAGSGGASGSGTYSVSSASTSPSGSSSSEDSTMASMSTSTLAVTTLPATQVTPSHATLHGVANPTGSPATGWFRYSTDNPGTCDDTFGTRVLAAEGTDLGSGDSSVSYSQEVVDLAARTTYYFCALASNANGLATGDVLSFATTGADTFPLHVSANGRYLETSSGVPFPISGDSSWFAQVNLTSAEVDEYLDDRKARGFTAILTDIIEHSGNVNKPPQDRAGNLPFSQRLDGQPYTGSPNGCSQACGSHGQWPADPYSNINAQAPDFTCPAAAYWAGADAFLGAAGQRGMIVLVWPSYVGYGGGQEGFMDEMVANDLVTGAGCQTGQPFANARKSKLWNYGAYLATRYKSYGNIIWVDGGDYGNNAANGGVFSAAEKNAVNDLMAGMKSVADQQSVLHTAHWSRQSLATDISFDAGSFDLESTYADAQTAKWGRRGYAQEPTKPAFMIEGYYEGSEKVTGLNRRFQWWAQLSNIGGLFYGHGPLFFFDSGWQTYLNAEGAQDMARLNAFFASIAWQNLVPSGLGGMQTLVTDGGGTADPQSSDYVAAAASPDGNLLVAYVPPDHTGSITIAMTAMSGSALARRYNPADGTSASLGTFANTGTQAFPPPDDEGDWVVILTR